MNIIPSIVSSLEKKGAANSLLVGLYSRIYDEVIRKEINLAGITAGDRVLHVGCGGIPFTAVKVARLTGARVWAIDRDQEAVAAAGRCVKAMKLQNQIEVVQADGCSSLPAEFDVALVALQAEPKKELLDNLLDGGASSARLVFRKPRSDLFDQYDLLPEQPPFTDVIKQNQVTFDSSVLYLK